MKAHKFAYRLDEATRETGMHVYATRTLHTCLMPGESTRTREATVAKAVRDKVLERLAHGVYAYRRHACRHDIRQEVAMKLRPGHFVYISCESALAAWGVIDQKVQGAITLLTSGRSQRYHTVVGDIILTHTARRYEDVFPKLVPPGDDDMLPTASPMLAYADMRRTRGCVDLVDMDDLRSVAQEAGDEV